MILDSTSHDLVIAKRDEHLITYKSILNFTQIDFFLSRRVDKVFCKDCNLIGRRILSTQQILLVLDMSNLNH